MCKSKEKYEQYTFLNSQSCIAILFYDVLTIWFVLKADQISQALSTIFLQFVHLMCFITPLSNAEISGRCLQTLRFPDIFCISLLKPITFVQLYYCDTCFVKRCPTMRSCLYIISSWCFI